MVDIIIPQPIIITGAEAQLIALLRKYQVFSMQFGQCVLHFADGELKKIEKNEAIFYKKLDTKK